jgi:uncharacterized damage-inducible protein DinB
MPALNLKEPLIQFTRSAQTMMSNDLKAIPQEQLCVSPGGCARDALNLVAECAMVNGFVSRFLQTGSFERPPAEDRQAHLASFDTAEKALSYLEQETNHLVAAIEAVDENTLGDVIETTPLGRPMTRFAIAQLPAVHMMYHDGQLNYIQTLHGDDKMHWN